MQLLTLSIDHEWQGFVAIGGVTWCYHGSGTASGSEHLKFRSCLGAVAIAIAIAVAVVAVAVVVS